MHMTIPHKYDKILSDINKCSKMEIEIGMEMEILSFFYYLYGLDNVLFWDETFKVNFFPNTYTF